MRRPSTAPRAAAALLLAVGCTADGNPIATDVEAATMPDTLLTSLRAIEPRPATGAPPELVVTARNATSRATDLLVWNTPFEPTLSADAFRVTRDGEPVPYRGRLVKRALPPPPEAIVRVAPGETIEATVALGDAYAMDVPGTYAIELVPRQPPIDDGTGAAARFATLVAVDADPVVVERR